MHLVVDTICQAYASHSLPSPGEIKVRPSRGLPSEGSLWQRPVPVGYTVQDSVVFLVPGGMANDRDFLVAIIPMSCIKTVIDDLGRNTRPQHESLTSFCPEREPWF